MKRIKYVEAGHNKYGLDKLLYEYIQSKGGLIKSNNRYVVQEGMDISRRES